MADQDLRATRLSGRGRLLVRHVRIVDLDGRGAAEGTAPTDVRIARDTVTEVGPGLATRGEDELDAAGRWAIPGLWDQHVHALQWARSTAWVDVAGAASPAEVVDRLADHLAGLPDRDAGRDRVIIGFGYRSGTWTTPASTRSPSV